MNNVRWEIRVPEKLAERVRRLLRPACFSSNSEFVRAALKEYVEKLELEYAEELTQ